MATSNYAFVLTLDANQALAAAKKWRAALEKELGSIQVGGLAGGKRAATDKTKELTTLAKFDAMLGKIGQSSDLMTTSLQAAGAMGFVYLGKRAIEATVDLAKVGIQSQRLETSFDELAAKVGETGKTLQSTMRVASGGTISDMQLIKTTAGLLASGIQTSTEEIETALELSRLKARQFGLTTAETYERMVTGARKFSVEMLDEIGINLKALSVYRRRAEELDVTVDKLTDAQKAEALWKAIIEDGTKELDEYRKVTTDAADELERLNVAWENWKAQAGKKAGPVVADIAAGLAYKLQEMSGAVPSVWIEWAKAEEKAGGDLIAQIRAVDEELQKLGRRANWADPQQVSLTGQELVQLLQELGATDAEIIEIAALLHEELPAGFRAAYAEGARWAALAEQFPAQLDATAASASGLVPVLWDVASAYLDMAESMAYTASVTQSVWGTLLEKPGAAEIAKQAGSTAGSGWNKITGLAGLLSTDQLRAMGAEYMTELNSLYLRMKGQEQWYIDLEVAAFQAGWDERIKTIREATKEIEGEYKTISQGADQAYSAFRSAVSGALQPTPVTALEMAQAGAGVYQDRWDEYARRLRDAMTNIQSPWRKMIPTDIEQAGEGAIQQWGQGQLERFYAGMMPEAVNWDAFARDFQGMITQQAGRENLIDRAIQELGARGITAGRSDVQKALGLSSPLEQMFFGGATPEQAGVQLQSGILTALGQVQLTPEEVAGPAGLVTQNLAKGIEAEFAEVAWTAVLVAAWTKNMTDNSSMIVGAGRALGRYIFEGMRDELEDAGIVDTVVDIVFSELARAADE